MIEALKNIGFVVTERLERKELSSDLQNRYSELPADYQEFLQRFQTITNESDNVWFNSIGTLTEKAIADSVGMNLS